MRVKLDFLQPKQNFLPAFAQILFRVTFITFIILFIVDYLFPGFVTNWFNPIWLLIIAMISSIMVIIKD